MQPEPQANRNPDLVWIKLHMLSMSGNMIELKATIRFSEQELEVLGGKVWFGLKRGTLRLAIENGRMPLETMGLVVPFENEIEVDSIQESTQETELKITVPSGFRDRRSLRESNSRQRKIYQCYTKGTETEPIWGFEVKRDLVLTGQLTEVTLGRIEVSEKPCTIKAKFEVDSPKDLHLTRASGIFPENIGTNKLAILERELFFRFVASRLQPILSEVEERYD